MNSFLYTIGYALTVVKVSYEVDDGIVYDMEVTDEGRDVQKYISLDQINEIELECYSNERKREALEIANFNQDRLADMITFRHLEAV